jgi:hypothetical protein
VIEMRVGKNNRVNLTRRDWGVLPVALAPFFLSLEKSAVDQNLKSPLATQVVGRIDQVLRASHGTGSTEKLDVGHDLSLITAKKKIYHGDTAARRKAIAQNPMP